MISEETPRGRGGGAGPTALALVALAALVALVALAALVAVPPAASSSVRAAAASLVAPRLEGPSPYPAALRHCKIKNVVVDEHAVVKREASSTMEEPNKSHH